ncbi:response regulator [Ectobacillus funiculus]|uniref:response regulator transcription factor n=1 Tax=Ectobacillus funiculus TaxID=137993 RepID=UPI00101C89AE|nr:response regulator [Ectobacillus funiculus]
METKTILIVDDEQITRQGLKKTLERWSQGKYEVLSAADGDEALEVFQKTKVHLLITDVNMPEMTGLALLKAVKEKGNKPVVIIVSGYPNFEYAQEAIRLGVINYLLKPVSKQKLIEAVEQALETEASIERADYIEKVADPKLLNIESSQTSKSPIKEALQYVNNNLSRQISLKDVAGTVHLNPSYFSVLFKEQTRLTFSEYLTRKRLQTAKKLLLTTNLPIEEVAQETGYQTAKYFIKLFKEYEGITPSKYRKMAELEDSAI